MKIGILTTSIGDFGIRGFYNSQEIGLAKALDKLFDEVKVYKLVSANQKASSEDIVGCENATLISIPSRKFGTNGVVDINILDNTLDVLIYFSDTQISVPKVYAWTVRNKMRFLPYIGVLESHSTNRFKRLIMDFLFQRNLRVYEECHCLVKTPKVKYDLLSRGVDNVSVTPVGLDLNLVRMDYTAYNRERIKEKYNYNQSEKIILFIGRLTNEKQPLRMIEIFAEVLKRDADYRLVIVGVGELKDAIVATIMRCGVSSQVKMFDRIPNNDIWELYSIADSFVNLNRDEIFGMAILEAMYYGCKVIAWKAPGPNFIIENGISGWLVDSNTQVIESVINITNFSSRAQERIINEFTWDNTAKKIARIVGE